MEFKLPKMILCGNTKCKTLKIETMRQKSQFYSIKALRKEKNRQLNLLHKMLG